jgi:hypothetical protein
MQKTNNVDPSWNVQVIEHGSLTKTIPQGDFLKAGDFSFQYAGNVQTESLVRKRENAKDTKALGHVCKTTSGFGGKSELITEQRKNSRQIQTLKGESIGRYELKKKYWFEFAKQNITGRTTDPSKLGAKPKILLRKTGNTLIATFDDSGIFPEQSLYFLYELAEEKLSYHYILGLLNSKLLTFYYRYRLITNPKSIAQLKKFDLDAMPICTINFDDASDALRYRRIVALVEQMLALHKQRAAAQTAADREMYQRQIDATDTQIDALVYALYGLTEEEIKIVEGA